MHDRITDVIFDLDGTLIDSAPSILGCFAATLASHGREPVVPLAESLIGPPLRETLRRLSGVDDAGLLDSMSEGFKRHYDLAGYKETKMFPGVDGMLHDLKAAGYSLHIATNKRLNPTRLILDHLGWGRLFGSIYASDVRQPPFGSKSEMLAALLGSQDIKPGKAVYVGDRSDDRNAAAANGMDFIAAAWGYSDAVLAADAGCAVAGRAEAIVRLLCSEAGEPGSRERCGL